MALFLLAFFLIYGGMHLYLFAKIKGAFHPGVFVSLSLILFFAIMIIAPVAIRVLERSGFETLARYLSFVGYSWMGVLFLFVVVSLILDFSHLLWWVGSRLTRKDVMNMHVPPFYAFLVPMIASLMVNVYGFFEARNLNVKMIVLETPRISQEAGRIRIVQVSDVHLGLIIQGERLKPILEVVKQVNPDILVSTGDLVDGQIDNLHEAIELLKNIRPKYGKYAVLGNHEYFAGIEQSLEFLNRAGFVVLRGEGMTIEGMITLLGVDDPTGIRYGSFKDVSEEDLFARFPRDTFTILLKHRPVVESTSMECIDLQLSGHTHGGQIFPFCFITKLFFPLHAGYFTFGKRIHLYVSRGTGTWGPPVRVLSPPEITVIDLVHVKSK